MICVIGGTKSAYGVGHAYGNSWFRARLGPGRAESFRDPCRRPGGRQLEAQLVQSRTRLNELYQSSAAAAEQLNGARYRLAETRKQLDRERRRARDTTRELAESSAVVAALTVEQLQNGAGAAKIEVLVGSATPTQLLERVAAYASTAEAMTAKLDEVAANQTVHRVSVERMAAAEQRMQAAVARQAAAERAIAASIAEAESAASSVEREREQVLRELAAKQLESSQSSSNDKPRSIPRLTATTLSSRSHRHQSRAGADSHRPEHSATGTTGAGPGDPRCTGDWCSGSGHCLCHAAIG